MRKAIKNMITIGLLVFVIQGCFQNKNNPKSKNMNNKSASQILGNPKYLAISYGGYREKSRDVQPSISELKDDMKILSAMGVGLLRTYNVKLAQASNLLKAISELKKENPSFEMYVMLGAWIDCENAWTDKVPNHNEESVENENEINRAVQLAKKYPNIVKVIAVGNEAMVKWAESYYVQPNVILKWVNHLQQLKRDGELPSDLWVTSSDNFASWGGGGSEYHVEDLNKLIESVDFISMHTYPMHDTHYNPEFWGVPNTDVSSKENKIEIAMKLARNYAIQQYEGVYNYMKELGIQKPIHIGETGWASNSNGYYGSNGSKATDEYKEGLYYKMMREWTNEKEMSCFYFEAFDEQWKDATNPEGSENHFGLINLKSEVKFALWNLVDANVFEGLTRDGKKLKKTYNGSLENLMEDVHLPPVKEEILSY